MTPGEFKTWFQAMGFASFDVCAVELGRSVRQCKAYAYGEAEIPLTVALACLYLLSARRGTVVVAEFPFMQREGKNQTSDRVGEV